MSKKEEFESFTEINLRCLILGISLLITFE